MHAVDWHAFSPPGARQPCLLHVCKRAHPHRATSLRARARLPPLQIDPEADDDAVDGSGDELWKQRKLAGPAGKDEPGGGKPDGNVQVRAAQGR